MNGAAGAEQRIAIVGMAGRFPEARDVEAFWELLASGREAITFFSDEELRAVGVAPSLLADPGYVRARGVIDAPGLFDAAFFGFTPREADIIDPQHRLLLECAWEALERAGYDGRRYEGLIGVFAGSGANTYLLFNLARNRGVVDAVGIFQAMIASGSDFLATRISYKLSLRGPSFTVQTACSTSLVAVHLACQSLINGECDMALAGGVRIQLPRSGYLYQPGGIFSPDGHCRPFDAAGQGTLDGEGMGLVVLKRLEDALADGDRIRAVILGSAINNDGSGKIGFTAPSAEGQSEVIAVAQALSGVEPATIGYVEAHGTATPMGDPIEVSALKQVFAGSPKGSCALGSVKSNLGHLDAAAGVASLIKAVLALEHHQIPPTVHFERPNPALELESSPFYVNSGLVDWPAGAHPRRAAVSSFGMGGTNAHLVLEEAPEVPAAPAEHPSRPHQLLLLSAATETALETATLNLIEHLRRHPDLDLADVAFTLQVGRRLLPYRRMAVCSDVEDAVATLGALDPRRVLTRSEESESRPVVFLFPGQGSQYPGMAEQLYRGEPTFREQIDRCAEVLRAEGVDLLAALYPRERGPEAGERLKQTAMAQVAIFAVEHALARLWMEWGVVPEAMIGHSVGEYVAAVLAGVFPFGEAARLVAARGRLMQELPAGAMLSVSLPEEELRPLLSDDLALAAVNAPSLCVASGEREAIAALASRLEELGVSHRLLHTSHAFHSPMMEPALGRFATVFAGLRPQAPSIPFVSNLTGTWIRPEEATDPGYWVRHLRQTVRFSEGLEKLFARGGAVLLEVGPGRALSSLARQHPGRPSGQKVLSSLPVAQDADEDLPVLLRALGQLWLAGVAVDWRGFYAHERRLRTELPTYPFERKLHWVEPQEGAVAAGPARGRQGDVADWTWAPLWKQTPPLVVSARPEAEGLWLIFPDGAGLGERLRERLLERGRRVVCVQAGEEEDYAALLDRLGERPSRIVHLGNLTPDPSPIAHPSPGRGAPPSGSSPLSREGGSAMGEGGQGGEGLSAFSSLLALVRALGQRGGGPLHVGIVSSGLQRVESRDEPDPLKALLLGITLTLPQELPGVTCQSLDVNPEDPEIVETLLTELEAAPEDPVVAYRGAARWVRTFEPLRLDGAGSQGDSLLRERGTYLITGGLGGVGLEIAGLLARDLQARLVLLSRTALPPRQEWFDRAGSDELLRKLLELEGTGAEVLTLAADVTSPESMQAALAAARERFGPIHGVVHAAGLPGSGVMQLMPAQAAEGALAPKVRGTLLLEELLAGEPLDFFVLCSSLSAVLGGPGQADYAAANAFLDAFAQSRSRRGRRVVAIDWDAWRGVGMAAGPSASLGTRTVEPVRQYRQVSHPLLQQRAASDEEEVFLSRLCPSETWVLDEHRLGGHPVVPGTAYLEMAGAAFREVMGNGSAVEMRDMSFIVPLRVGDGETREVKTVLQRQDGGFRFSVASLGGGGGSGWQEHVVGTLQTAAGEPARIDLSGLIAGAQREEVLGEEYREYIRTAGLGPRWESLRKAYVGDGYALGWMELAPELSSDVESFGLHPALLDIATSFGEEYVPEKAGHYLPLSYRKVVVHGPLPRRAWSYARFRPGRADGETILFDVKILDEEGLERIGIEEFVIKRVDVGQTMRGHSEMRARELASEEKQAEGPGMAPSEALEVLRRILSGPRLPQVAVSTVPLPEVLEVRRSLLRDVAAGKSVRISAAGHGRPDVSTAYVEPRSELEAKLAAIWEEVLGIAPVGAMDDFFELGGHSLLGTQLMSRLRAELQVELPLPRLFEAPVLADLAALVEVTAALRGEAPAADSAIPRVPRAPGMELPLSYGQERLWFLQQLEPGNPFYDIFGPLWLRGDLDVAALQATLGEIARRHETLRTTFVGREGFPFQRISPPAPVPLPVVDLRGLPEPQAEALRLVDAEGRWSFDLERGPVLRVTLLRLESATWMMLFNMHHIASDGWSLGLVMEELAKIYGALHHGTRPDLPELPIQYADFAVWQRGWLQGEKLQAEIDWWKKELGGAPMLLDLPMDRPRPAVQRYRGTDLKVTVPRELTDSLRELGQRCGATLFMTLLASFDLLLHRATGQKDLVVGTPTAGRTRTEVEGLIGCFINTLALRSRLEDESVSFLGFLEGVRARALEAYRHQDLPFERVVEGLQVPRSLSHNPVFQVMFALQNAPLRKLDLAGVELDPVDQPTSVVALDLTLGLREIEGALWGVCLYKTDLFDAATAERLMARYLEVLEWVAAHPESPLAELPRWEDWADRAAPAAAAPLDEQEALHREEVLRARVAQRQEGVEEKRAGLSDEKRALLEKMLRTKAGKR